MKIKRHGKVYTVLQHCKESNEVQVEEDFSFKVFPHTRKLKMWWSLDDCEVIEK